MLADVLKLRVSQEALAEKLALVARAVSTRTAVLVLGGIRLKVENGQLELAATDMELSLRTSLEADVDGEGEVVVPGRLLLDIVRSLPVGGRLDRAAQRRVGAADRRAARRATGCTRTRPRTSRGCPTSSRSQLHQVDREALLETIGRVGRSASRDESRPVLTGILVQFEPGKLVMAATDSYRLAVKETPLVEHARRARGDHPGPRAPGARADRGRRRRDPARRAREPRRLRHRRRLADDAPHRRAVPELPPAPAGAVRARAPAAARGAARRRAPRLADGAAQLAAPAALRRRRADRVGADAGRRRGARVAAGAVRGRRDGDRLQRGLPARRPRVGRLADGARSS